MAQDKLSADEARRLALAAQGFGSSNRAGRAKPGARQVLGMATRVQALQVDTVNVLVRAHYLPAYSRLGPYPMKALDRLTNVTHDLIEVRDGHQASYVPVTTEPLLRWRHPRRSGWRASVDAAYVADVERQVVERGPLALRDLADPRRRDKQAPSELLIRRRDGLPYAESSLKWGRPSDGKTVLDGLLHEGRVALAGRRGPDRLYDLVERVIPDDVRLRPSPNADEARRELVLLSARSLGAATLADLTSPFLLKVGETKAAVRDLVEGGELREVAVDGWSDRAFVAVEGTSIPRALDARALLGPFDSLTWSRDRTLRLFGFAFSFEIYVPEPKRRFGYYVLPFLLGDRLVGRVDLVADRKRSTLVVAGAFVEDAVSPRSIAGPLREELAQLASWLGLESTDARNGRGDLVQLLR